MLCSRFINTLPINFLETEMSYTSADMMANL
jgi:hypothetical protein